MENNEFEDAVEKLKTMDAEVQRAQMEYELREKQLDEIRPKRIKLENECQDKYNCNISELSSLLCQKEKEFIELVNTLEKELKEAKNG